MASPKPGSSPNIGATKALIRDAYNEIAAEYTAWAITGSHTRMEYVNELLALLPDPSASTVLELGCGAGTPVLEYLVQNVAHVLANDISKVQLDLARERCPERTTFLLGDMTALDIHKGRLDAAMGFYSVLHLPRGELPTMLNLLWGWLKDGGMLAMNLATEDEEEVRGKFFGAEMVWSGWDSEKSKTMVEEAGFQLLKAEVRDGKDLTEDDPDHGIAFLWILASKRDRQ